MDFLDGNGGFLLKFTYSDTCGSLQCKPWNENGSHCDYFAVKATAGAVTDYKCSHMTTFHFSYCCLGTEIHEYTAFPWFNIKCHLTSIGNPIIEIRQSYLHNGISFTGKMISLYWSSPLVISENIFYCLMSIRNLGTRALLPVLWTVQPLVW